MNRMNSVSNPNQNQNEIDLKPNWNWNLFLIRNYYDKMTKMLSEIL